MLSDVVRKHLLKDRKLPLNDDDLEIAIWTGWNARNDEVERLKSENARYQEALLKIKIMTDDPKSMSYHVAKEALKGE